MTPPPTLADLPDSALWSSRTWTDFQRLPRRARARTVIVLPLFGFADWGLGRPLDLEEALGTAVLRAALHAEAASAGAPVVLPPCRFVCGPYPHTVFGVDLETALDLVREIAAGVLAAGFSRLVLFNSSPWNEEMAGVAACDLRVDLELQTFVINLAALGLDLHPVRSPDRTAVQCAACACFDRLPEPDAPAADMRLVGFRPGHIRQPEPLAFDKPLEVARDAGQRVLTKAGARLASLLEEIARRKSPPKVRLRRPSAGAPEAKDTEGTGP